MAKSKIRQSKTWQGKTWQGKTWQGKTWQGKNWQGKTSQVRTWQGTAPVLSRCPQCDAHLAILSVISGSAGAEYWAMQCSGCNGIHLDIVEPPTRH